MLLLIGIADRNTLLIESPYGVDAKGEIGEKISESGLNSSKER